VGNHASTLVTSRLPTGILGSFDFCTRALGYKLAILHYEFMDFGDCGQGYRDWREAISESGEIQVECPTHLGNVIFLKHTNIYPCTIYYSISVRKPYRHSVTARHSSKIVCLQDKKRSISIFRLELRATYASKLHRSALPNAQL